jgi:EpsI family protein
MRPRLVGLAVGLLIPNLIVARWAFIVLTGAPVEASFPLPSELGPWAARAEEQLEDWVLAEIEPDAYLLRRYEREGAVPVWIYVALYAQWSGFGRSPHTPEGCYPAAGWEIMRERSVDVPVGGGKELEASLLDVQKTGQEQHVLHWFQPPGRWSSSGAVEQLLRLRDSVGGRPQFAFVRLSTHADAAAEPTALIELAGLVAPAIRKVVEGIDGIGERTADPHRYAGPHRPETAPSPTESLRVVEEIE